jgi:hypothetical protein
VKVVSVMLGGGRTDVNLVAWKGCPVNLRWIELDGGPVHGVFVGAQGDGICMEDSADDAVFYC